MAFSNGTFRRAYVVVRLPSPSAQLPIVSVRLEALEERAMWLTPPPPSPPPVIPEPTFDPPLGRGRGRRHQTERSGGERVEQLRKHARSSGTFVTRGRKTFVNSWNFFFFSDVV